MRALFQHIVIYSKYVRKVQNVQIKPYTRAGAIIGDHVTQLSEETLTGRLLNYLIIDKNQSKPEKIDKPAEILDLLKDNQTTVLEKCNTEQIVSTLTTLSNPFEYNHEFLSVLNTLDSECRRRLCQLDTKDILKILHTYMNIIPHRIVEYQFYREAVAVLYKKSGTLSKSDLIQLIFFIGLRKRNSKAQTMLKKCLTLLTNDFINDLTTEELCIICNAAFKTSTKISRKSFLDKVNTYLKDNLCLLQDPALFVTLIKTIRHNRYQSDDLLSTITCAIFFNRTLKCYSFSALCHIFALYSDYLYYDETLIEAFAETAIKQLEDSDYTSKHSYFKEQPRLKDIKRFLWCLSNLNYKHLTESAIKDVIIPNIKIRLDVDGYENNYADLIDIILYLWMLNYRAYEFIPSAVTKEIVEVLRASSSPSKARLNLLLSTMYFEDPKFYKQLSIHPRGTEYVESFQLEKRPTLQRVLDNLKLISVQCRVNKYELSCQLPYLNIIGITGYEKKIYKTVHIEVLDDFTSMKNTDSLPSGLMQLKLRILEKLDEGLIVIRADEVDSMTDEELQDFLLDELDLVC